MAASLYVTGGGFAPDAPPDLRNPDLVVRGGPSLAVATAHTDSWLRPYLAGRGATVQAMGESEAVDVSLWRTRTSLPAIRETDAAGSDTTVAAGGESGGVDDTPTSGALGSARHGGLLADSGLGATIGASGGWAAARYFPAYALPDLWAIEACESRNGTHPDTYDLTAANAGPLQINKAVWEGFFWREYGWTWEQVVTDPDTHYHAAAIIWERAGRTWEPWSCRP